MSRRRLLPLWPLLVAVSLFAVSPTLSATTISYSGDTYPEFSTPPFEMRGIASGASTFDGIHTIDDTSDYDWSFRTYSRDDAFPGDQDSVMRFRMKVVSSTGLLALGIQLRDGTKSIWLGFGTSHFGLLDNHGFLISWCGASVNASATDGFHTYEVRKYAGSRVTVHRDGNQVLDIPYSCIPGTGGTGQGLGATNNSGKSLSLWDYVIFQGGSAEIEGTPPTVVGTSPVPDSTVSGVKEISITFSEAMHLDTIRPDRRDGANWESLILEGAVHGRVKASRVNYDAATRTATFITERPLIGDNELYTMRVVGTGAHAISDESLNALDGDCAGSASNVCHTGQLPSGDGTAGGDFVFSFVVDDPDSDEDGFADSGDRCPSLYNPDQEQAVACVSTGTSSGRCLPTEIQLLKPGQAGDIVLYSSTYEPLDSLSFETFVSSCDYIEPIEFYLNGVLVGTTSDAFLNCDCRPGIQGVTISDTSLLDSLWNPNGGNVLSVRKAGIEDYFSGTWVGWARALLRSGTTTRSECLYSAVPGDCDLDDLCSGTSSEAPISVDASVEPLVHDSHLTEIPYVDGLVPERVSLLALPDGPSKICVSAQSSPYMVGSSQTGEIFRLDLNTGAGSLLGTLPAGLREVEYDDVTERAYLLGGGPYVGDLQEFDLSEGHLKGESVRYQDEIQGLEFVGSQLYGVAYGSLRLLSSTSHTVIGQSPFDSRSLAYDRDHDVFYAIESPGDLLTINRHTGNGRRVGVTGQELDGLEFGPDGFLYAGGVGRSAGMLYRIDPATAMTTLVGPTGFATVSTLALIDYPPPDCWRFVKNGETDLSINGATCNVVPEANAGADRVIECASVNGSYVTLDGSLSLDGDSSLGTNDDLVLFEWFRTDGDSSAVPLGNGEVLDVTLPLGSHGITLQVTDSAGATATDSAAIEVRDSIAPHLEVQASVDRIWPPNHRMVPVDLTASAHDVCDPDPATGLAVVESNEPDDAEGPEDGKTIGDIEVIEAGPRGARLLLRAERLGGGSGRLYTASYRVADRSGNTSTVSTAVLVPRDQRGSSEPVALDMDETAAGTTIHWNLVQGASFYNIIKGSLSHITSADSYTVLDDAICIGRGVTNGVLSGSGVDGDPPPNEGFYFLIEYFDGHYSGYGTAAGTGDVVVTSGNSCR